MPARSLRGKRGRSRDPGTDRAVIAAVFLAVTIVLLLTGFTGPSVELSLPGRAGWLYIGVVIVVATVILVWLFCFDGKRKRANTSGSKTLNPRLKRIPLW
jgi:Na+/melibiose symporter-like transporter